MSDRTPRRGVRLWGWIARIDWMMVFPVAAVVAWMLGEDAMAVTLAVILPLCLVLHLQSGPRGRRSDRPDHFQDTPMTGAAVRQLLDEVLEDCTRRSRTTALLNIEVDDLQITDGGWGMEACDRVMRRVLRRVKDAMREHDRVIRIGDHGLIAILGPVHRADLDGLMALVDRVQAAVTEPITLDGRTVRMRCCIGICSEKMAPEPGGASLLAAADCALRIARRQGDDAVRTFTADILTQMKIDHTLSRQTDNALASGEIRPWFQPQVDTRTGRLAGFEALARWHHPDLGILSPDQFLPTIACSGRSADLGEIILKGAIAALIAWDKAGLDVPCVGVNVSLDQLADPRLAERIIWQIDRYDVRPDRIAIEILETVTLRNGDETIMRNVDALREAGFRLDLDDFGTGAASIRHIAQFGVHRIKIDRSFIHKIDQSPKQREVVAAILSLAKSLAIDTLAEGVETPEEQRTLAEMGCPHVQGFVIAKPMPFDLTVAWINAQPCARTNA